MKGIKLTPFLLFVILLVVLVFAMLFGSTMKPLLENMEQRPSPTHFSMIVPTKKISGYDENEELDTILQVGDVGGIYFDKRNGNVINETNETTFTAYDRTGLTKTTTDESSDLSTSMQSSDIFWAKPASTDRTIVYCGNGMNTVIFIINSASNTIDTVYRYILADEISHRTDSLGTTHIESGGNIADFNSTQDTTAPTDGVTTISKGISYSADLGIKVENGTPSTSLDFLAGISIQWTDKVLVLSTLIQRDKIITLIVVKNGTQYNGSAHYTPITATATAPATATASAPAVDPAIAPPVDPAKSSNDDTISIKLTTDTGDTEQTASCNSQYKANAKNDDRSQNSDYMLKSEIVPPVCPGCPPCPASTNCNLSINSKGEMVDCTGKKYTPEGELPGASPSTWEGSLGKSVSSTVGSVGSVVETGLDKTGDVANKTLDTAGGAFDKTLDTASGLAGDLGKGVGDIASGLGKGLAGLGSGASDLVQGVSSDVAGLGNNVINSTTGLIENTGSGFMKLTEQQKQQYLQQQQMMQQGGYMQPGMGYGYPMQQQGMGYGYPMQQQGMGYSYPQQCAQTGSNFVPITNDFSQFA